MSEYPTALRYWAGVPTETLSLPILWISPRSGIRNGHLRWIGVVEVFWAACIGAYGDRELSIGVYWGRLAQHHRGLSFIWRRKQR